MLSTRFAGSRLRELFVGEYRRRYERFLTVKASGFPTVTHGLKELPGTLSFPGGIEISLSAGIFHVSAPMNAKISVMRYFWWSTIFNGKSGAFQSPAKTMEFEIPADRSCSIRVGKFRVEFGILEKRPSFWLSLVSALEFRTIANNVWNLLKSGALHAALVFFVLAGINADPSSWLDTLLHKAPEQAEIVPVELSTPAEGKDSDFGGRGLVLAPSAEDISRMNRQATKAASGLSQIMAKMRSIHIGSATGKVAGSSSHQSSLIGAISARLGVARGTNVVSAFQKVGDLKLAQASRPVVDSSSGDISPQDLERVAEIFRALQDEFRGCYESALLKFEDLAVTVKMESAVDSNGYLGLPVYDLAGRSNSESETLLTGCLTKVLRKAKVGRSLSGARIRNQFIFKS